MPSTATEFVYGFEGGIRGPVIEARRLIFHELRFLLVGLPDRIRPIR